jgi:hypothetical protein
MSSSNNSTPRSTSHQHSPTSTATNIPVTRSTIDDFREIVREQSFIIPNNSSFDHVSIKKYPPLPDIAVPNTNSTNNTFFRTETILTTPPPKTTQVKKQMFYHFAPTQSRHLPALNKRYVLPTMCDVMDLDEDLPQCNTTIAHRAATYTSPGDRVISPIKRPSAPLPPASAQPKRPGQNAYVYGEENQDEDDEENYSGLEDDDDDDSQSFNEQFYRYNHQPIRMINRRIDHYSHDNRHMNGNDKQNTLIINGDHDEPVHPLDSSNIQP